ncbi:MAG: hypothetical protein SFY81_09645 [Verrucomicrobiota bacterium]|nr:hypothetical protein [Verrucomicrobiota bacterium]
MSLHSKSQKRPTTPRGWQSRLLSLLIALIAFGFVDNATAQQATTNATVSTIAGAFAGFVDGDNTVSQFNGPQGIAFALNGNLYIADSNNDAVRRLTPGGNVVETVAQRIENGISLLDNPVAIAVSSTLGIYVVNQGSGTVLKLNTTGDQERVIETGFSSPTAVAVDAQDRIYVAHLTGLVRVYENDTFIRSFQVAGATGLRGIAVMEDSTIVVSDSLQHTVRFLNSDGSERQTVGMPGSAGMVNGVGRSARFNQPWQIARGTGGSVVVADRGNHRVRLISGGGSVNVLYGINPAAWENLSDPSIFPGWADGSVAVAEVRDPVGVTVSTNGTVYGTEFFYHIVRQVSGLTLPTNVVNTNIFIVDVPVITPSSGLFTTGVVVQVTSGNSTNGLLSPLSQVYYTIDGSNPTPDNGIRVPVENGRAVITFTDFVDLNTLRVSTYGPNGEFGGTVQGGQVALPRPAFTPNTGYSFTNVNLVVYNTNAPGGLFPAGTRLFYTLNGLSPQLTDTEIPIVNGLGRIVLTAPVDLSALQVRAFIGTIGSEIATGSPGGIAPVRISFGFPSGEASSVFIAAPGQRFFAPVTLSNAPRATMYGLQFNLSITNLPGSPAGAYSPGFESMLVEVLPRGNRIIPPQTFEFSTAFLSNIVVVTPSGTNISTVTNYVLTFRDLLFTNTAANLLGVGWLERATFTNLYNTKNQDLISYSQAHDTLFLNANGQVVLGGYSFVLPPTADASDTYQIRIGRPSGNSDGVREDVFIEAPDGSNTNIPIRAVQTITIGEIRYTVGDAAPFRWFNAGDFGNGQILNNDMEQLHQTIIYGVNSPPPGSDFYDTMDTCCVTTNGVDVSAAPLLDGNDTIINSIGFGDGILDILDLFVNFRRSLDPTLVWYERYWSGGVRRASVVPNIFRQSVSRQSDVSLVGPALSPIPPGAEQPHVTFVAGNTHAPQGGVARVPIYAQIEGPYPIRGLHLNLEVQSIDVPVELTENLRFIPNPVLGNPTFGGAATRTLYGAAWMNLNTAGLTGTNLVGTLEIPIPSYADPNCALRVHIKAVSATPDGLYRIPASSKDAVVVMSNRTALGWNDGITDQWRIQHFGSLINILSAASADADGDGMSNMEEFKAGTLPTDLASVFRMIAARKQSGDKPVTLRWPSAQGKQYRIEAASSLNSTNWITIQQSVTGNGNEMEFEPPADGDVQFYRVVLVE